MFIFLVVVHGPCNLSVGASQTYDGLCPRLLDPKIESSFFFIHLLFLPPSLKKRTESSKFGLNAIKAMASVAKACK